MSGVRIYVCDTCRTLLTPEDRPNLCRPKCPVCQGQMVHSSPETAKKVLDEGKK